MTTLQATLPTVSVPNLAEIVRRLGGFDTVEPGASYGISLDRNQIHRPQDEKPDLGEDEIGNKIEKHFEWFPDIDGKDHTWKTLIISLFWRHETYQEVSVGLGASVEHDHFHESQWMFRVPLQGWESGEWQIYSLTSQIPFLMGIYQRSTDSEEVAWELAEGCQAFDRDSILLSACLRIVRDAYPES
jgi:hypothetical protein